MVEGHAVGVAIENFLVYSYSLVVAFCVELEAIYSLIVIKNFFGACFVAICSLKVTGSFSVDYYCMVTYSSMEIVNFCADSVVICSLVEKQKMNSCVCLVAVAKDLLCHGYVNEQNYALLVCLGSLACPAMDLSGSWVVHYSWVFHLWAFHLTLVVRYSLAFHQLVPFSHCSLTFYH